jgi:hypothetical protein
MHKGITNWRSKKLNKYLKILGPSIILGIVWFHFLFRLNTLNFLSVDWIYNNGKDLLQHQIAWEWFRQSPWSFPLGYIEDFGYPFGTYAAFSDPLLLIAIPLKIFSKWLSDSFQYIGIWQLISVIGQLMAGTLLLKEFSNSYYKSILGASLLVLSPPFIFRFFYHETLTAQWIILLGIWFIFLERKGELWRGAWITIAFVSMLIHIYFVVMLVPLWGISSYYRLKNKNRIPPLILESLILIAVIITVSYSIGFFSLDKANFSAEELGEYSWNLDGFLNTQSFSSIISPLPLSSYKQYEGFAYLGLGNLIIIPFAIIIFLMRKDRWSRILSLLPFILISIVFVLLALSNKAYIGDHVLWDISLPWKLTELYSIVRSTGRFIWPVFYFIVIFGIIQIIMNSRFSALILALAIVIQLFDIQPLYKFRRIDTSTLYQSKLKSDFWDKVSAKKTHIVLLPAAKPVGVYEPFAIYARKKHLTLNLGYFARADNDAIYLYGENIFQDLLNGKIDDNTLYIVWDPEYISNLESKLRDNIIVCKIDGYTVIISPNNPILDHKHDEIENCTIPKYKYNNWTKVGILNLGQK